jgi:small subunit ribosomal protein S17e
MGRIKTFFVKHIAYDLFEKQPEIFSTSFEENKKAIEPFITVKSKRIRNMVVGYITTLKKRENHGMIGK